MKPLSGQVHGWLFQVRSETFEVFAKGLAKESGFHPFRVKIRERLRDKFLYSARTVLTSTPGLEAFAAAATLFLVVLCAPADPVERKVWAKVTQPA